MLKKKQRILNRWAFKSRRQLTGREFSTFYRNILKLGRA